MVKDNGISEEFYTLSSIALLVFINKTLLEYDHSHSFRSCLGLLLPNSGRVE